MAGGLLVINPNSSAHCTAAIDRAAAPFRRAGGMAITAETLTAGPPGIHCQRDADAVVAPLRAFRAARDNEADGFIVACFSDPGLGSLREDTDKPVFGIQECGTATALTLGERFGVISLFANSAGRQRRAMRGSGLDARFAGARPVEMGVPDLADAALSWQRIAAAGEALVERDGADVVIFGCAGMADHRDRLAEHLGVTVVEPTQAAIGMALARFTRGW